MALAAASWPVPCDSSSCCERQQVMHAVTFQGLDGHAGAVGRFLPARCGQFGLKLRQFVPPGSQQIRAVGFIPRKLGAGR